ncbi:adenylate kinase [Symbiobacterium terraclitae]|uniref:adenylate kinase n=1 Tax=Symbiobacterium terraclitae TaxID=557451 RepID=UPI0035B50AB7
MPESPRPIGRRIVVVGTTGSGKTTLARQLAQRLGCPHVEADVLFWGPHWTKTPVDEFRTQVDRATAGDCWTFDGNYSKVRDITWGRADTLVWLDYPLPLVLWRLLRRTIRRSLNLEQLWNGNRETLWHHLFTRDSLFLWALQTHGRYRREYPLLLQRPEYAHLAVIRLRSPGATAAWLASLKTRPRQAKGSDSYPAADSDSYTG